MTISCYLLGEVSYARAVSLKVTTFRGTLFLLSYTVEKMNHCLGKSGDRRPHKDSARFLLGLSDKTLNHTTFTEENIFRIR